VQAQAAGRVQIEGGAQRGHERDDGGGAVVGGEAPGVDGRVAGRKADARPQREDGLARPVAAGELGVDDRLERLLARLVPGLALFFARGAPGARRAQEGAQGREHAVGLAGAVAVGGRGGGGREGGGGVFVEAGREQLAQPLEVGRGAARGALLGELDRPGEHVDRGLGLLGLRHGGGGREHAQARGDEGGALVPGGEHGARPAEVGGHAEAVDAHVEVLGGRVQHAGDARVVAGVGVGALGHGGEGHLQGERALGRPRLRAIEGPAHAGELEQQAAAAVHVALGAVARGLGGDLGGERDDLAQVGAVRGGAARGGVGDVGEQRAEQLFARGGERLELGDLEQGAGAVELVPIVAPLFAAQGVDEPAPRALERLRAHVAGDDLGDDAEELARVGLGQQARAAPRRARGRLQGAAGEGLELVEDAQAELAPAAAGRHAGRVLAGRAQLDAAEHDLGGRAAVEADVPAVARGLDVAEVPREVDVGLERVPGAVGVAGDLIAPVALERQRALQGARGQRVPLEHGAIALGRPPAVDELEDAARARRGHLGQRHEDARLLRRHVDGRDRGGRRRGGLRGGGPGEGGEGERGAECCAADAGRAAEGCHGGWGGLQAASVRSIQGSRASTRVARAPVPQAARGSPAGRAPTPTRRQPHQAPSLPSPTSS
jgi:hypothetical protein